MKGRALDSNNDIVIRNGSIVMVDGAEEVVQSVRSRLLLYYGEWFLDIQAGVPYFEEIFIKPVNLGNVESILKTTILQTPGVLRLLEFAMTYEGGSIRKLVVAASVETIYGEINLGEVTVNA